MADPTIYDVARKKASDQEAATLQTQRDALARRQAQTGGGVSGALIKQEGEAVNQSNQRLANTNEGITAQEGVEKQRQKEIADTRSFQTSERLGGQDFANTQRLGGQEFAANQSLLGQKFATGERLGSQDFAGSQAEKGQQFQHAENYSNQAAAAKLQAKALAAGATQQDKALAAAATQQQKGLDAQKLQFDATFAQSKDQFNQTLAQSKYVDSKNIDLANKIQYANQNQPGLIGSVFKDVGNLTNLKF